MATLEDITDLFNLRESKSLTLTHPVKFSGLAEENSHDFIKRLEQYAGYNKIVGEQKAQLFAILLRGLASDWYDTLDGNIKTDYDLLKQSFMQHFQSQSIQFLNQQKLETHRLEEGQSIETYINTVMKMSNNLNLSENEKKMALLRGLPAEMKADIIVHNPDNVINTIQKLRLVHESYSMKKQEKKNKESRSYDLASLGAAVANIEKLVQRPSIQSVEKYENKDEIKRSHYAPIRRWGETIQNDRGIYKFTGNCYYCGRVGHIARYCLLNKGSRNNYGGQRKPNYYIHPSQPIRQNNTYGRHWVPQQSQSRMQMPPQGN